RIARVRHEQRREAAPHDLATQVVRREAVAALALEEDRDRGERLEDVEQLLVRGVVGQEMAEVDAAEARRRACQRRAASARYADVLRGVLRRRSLPVETVVECSYRLAQLGEAGDGRILLVVGRDRDLVDARGRSRQLARLGL